MSDAAEEAMDGLMASEEETEEKQESPEKQSSSPEKSNIWGAGEIIEGKRAKKTVARLDMQVSKKAVKLSIGEGSGEKLGDIPRTCHQLMKIKAADLKPLHSILFDRPGKLSSIKKNIRQFNGFSFDADSEQFSKKRDKLQKNFTNSKLKLVCGVLDLEKKGTHSDLVERIMSFLVSPKSSGKRLTKKKKKSKKNLSGDDAKTKKKRSSKQKPSSTSSPKKSKSGSKSKAIVMDSSSDEDEEEDEEEEEEKEEKTAAAETDGSEVESEGEDKQEEEEEQDQSEEEEEEEEESPKPKARGKAGAKKSTPAMKQRTQSKKPPKKRSRKELTDSESESSENDDEDDEPKKKKSKPAAKTKKADSSSNSKTNNNNTTADDSSDEDEPLSKIIKKTPSDEQLKETVQSLLKEVDLEELTMKKICQKVFDAYSEHDLSSKKAFIKETVKSLIT